MYQRKKALGQNFLKDSKVISQIVSETLSERKNEKILEIGIGKGALTQKILGQIPNGSFLGIEKDRGIIPKELSSLNILYRDFLSISTLSELGLDPFIVVSNLPYSSSLKILKHLHEWHLHSPGNIQKMVLMFQKEVGKRILAKPGERERGSLSVWIQNAWEVKKLTLVRARSFSPAPKVDSIVLVFRPRKTPRIPVHEQGLNVFDRVLREGFSHPRKMIRSNLSDQILSHEKEIDLSQRPHQLSWRDWGCLYNTALKHL